jgi:DNA-binding transcriptional MerR regulator
VTGYRIKTVSTLTGVPRNTLLAWERRYRFVSPGREGNRYRSYTDADVALIREVKALVEQGHPVSEAVGIVRSRAAVPAAPGPAPSGDVIAATTEALLDALLEFDRARADELVPRLLQLSYEELLDGVLFPILDRVGEGWANGSVTVVQEHFVSAFCRDQLVAILLRLGCGPTNGPRAVCACMPDESHELGLLGISIRLALRGYRVTHLGARVPADQLAEFVRTHPPALVCISVMERLPAKIVTAYARRLRRSLPARARLAIGGRGIPESLLAAPDYYRTFQDLDAGPKAA